MNEAVVVNDPEYTGAGLEGRMIEAEIKSDDNGSYIYVSVVLLGQPHHYEFREPYELLRMFRLSDSVFLPQSWVEASFDQIAIRHMNIVNDVQGKVAAKRETKYLNDLYDISDDGGSNE